MTFIICCTVYMIALLMQTYIAENEITVLLSRIVGLTTLIVFTFQTQINTTVHVV
jgi:hypothetical protein